MGLIFIIFVGVLFYFKAKKNQFNPYLWSFIGVGSFLFGIIIAGTIMYTIDSNIATKKNSIQTLLIAGFSGVVNSIVAWFLLQSKINEKKW